MTAFVSVAATSSEMSVWRGKLSFQEILWSLGIPITAPSTRSQKLRFKLGLGKVIIYGHHVQNIYN